MGARFLSPEWAQAATNALSYHPGFASAIEGAAVSVQFRVADTPEGGEVDYYVKVNNGAAVVEIGTLRKPDVTVTTNYNTAAAVSKGEMPLQNAFFSGRLKVSGNLAELISNQSALGFLADAVSALDIDY